MIHSMKLFDESKEKVEKTENKKDAAKLIKETGAELNDEEMEVVNGGAPPIFYKQRFI